MPIQDNNEMQRLNFAIKGAMRAVQSRGTTGDDYRAAAGLRQLW